MTDLPANQTGGFALSLAEQQERREHREWIGGMAITLLSHYWRDDDDEALTSAMGADWADVLEGLPREYLARARVRYMQDEPRRKPTPGAIYQLARSMMPLPKVVKTAPQPEPVKERCPPEVAQKICEAAGFTPKRFGGEND